MANQIIPLILQTGETVPLTIERVSVVNAVSPTVTVTRTDTGATVTIHDLTGDHTFDIYDGAKGDTGETGNGIASVTLNPDYTLTVSMTNGTSYTTPSIRGEKGEKGETGDTGNGIASARLNADYTLTITMTDGTAYTTGSIRGETGPTGATGPQGPQGVQGEKGDTGAPGYSPVRGTDYWTQADQTAIVRAAADEVFDQVDTNTYKEQVADLVRDMYTVSVSGTDPVIAAEGNHRYICGEVSTITITPPSDGSIFGVMFTSGSSVAIMTATGVTWPEWFDPTDLDTDTVYEMSVCNGYGVVCTWPSA